MSLEKVVRILKKMAVGKPGKVEAFGFDVGMVGVCLTGMDEREKNNLLLPLQMEAAEYSYRVVEVTDAGE